MKYIHQSGDSGIEFDRYFAYIQDYVGAFPEHLRSFVSESRFYDLSSVETLHDAHLKEIVIREVPPDRERSIAAGLEVRLALNGAYQRIDLICTGVKWYRAKGQNDFGYFDSFHSDLFTHEFRYEDGVFVHELEFVTASSIEIAFGSMEYRYSPYP